MSSGKNRVSEILRAGREAARSTGEVLGEFSENLRQPEDRGRHALEEETVVEHLREAAQGIADQRSVDSLREGASRVAGATGEALSSLVERVGRATASTRDSEAAAKAGQAYQRVGETVSEAAREAWDSQRQGANEEGQPQDIIDGEVLSETIHEEGNHRD
ncbi:MULTISPECIES: hypothetical protein [unclassified Corynebacterium]|uniref:hypothetical protein n=1 Tax=unclassified Corynebacterium TaxID=2624378 RepID=UPI0029CA9FF9|nr:MULTISPECIES: hypothetical protein [unclassified Corynebacterium]WPF66372.1 hypothetical protein OLX12_01180 [Corynebacterium sp. 22KM0430]WPF68862.1 hypothetical protein OLW90_01180 [Corynebacterium sp. 21KM1197]